MALHHGNSDYTRRFRTGITGRAAHAFLFLLLLSAVSTYAQQNTFHFAANGPLNDVAVRSLIEAVRDVDPNGSVLHHFDDRSLVRIDVLHTVTEGELRESIGRYGIGLLAGTPDIPRDVPVHTTATGRPLYVVTGDASADRARYEQAVLEWNHNNPHDKIHLPLRVNGDP